MFSHILDYVYFDNLSEVGEYTTPAENGTAKLFRFTMKKVTEVYDENGQRVEPRNVIFANKAYVKGNRDGVQIRINAEVKGEHTYTFYAVNADGVRSPDSRSIDVIVR